MAQTRRMTSESQKATPEPEKQQQQPQQGDEPAAKRQKTVKEEHQEVKLPPETVPETAAAAAAAAADAPAVQPPSLKLEAVANETLPQEQAQVKPEPQPEQEVPAQEEAVPEPIPKKEEPGVEEPQIPAKSALDPTNSIYDSLETTTVGATTIRHCIDLDAIEPPVEAPAQPQLLKYKEVVQRPMFSGPNLFHEYDTLPTTIDPKHDRIVVTNVRLDVDKLEETLKGATWRGVTYSGCTGCSRSQNSIVNGEGHTMSCPYNGAEITYDDVPYEDGDDDGGYDDYGYDDYRFGGLGGIVPVEDDHGDFLGVVVAPYRPRVYDRAAAKIARQERRQKATEKFKEHCHDIWKYPVPFLFTDKNGVEHSETVVCFSPIMESILGIQELGLESHAFWKMIHPNKRAKKEAIEKGEAYFAWLRRRNDRSNFTLFMSCDVGYGKYRRRPMVTADRKYVVSGLSRVALKVERLYTVYERGEGVTYIA